jgi:hypothetical protein
VHGEYLFRAEFFFHGGQMMLQSLWTGMVSFEQLIGIGEVVTHSPLPHHRTCGSAYGGSAD